MEASVQGPAKVRRASLMAFGTGAAGSLHSGTVPATNMGFFGKIFQRRRSNSADITTTSGLKSLQKHLRRQNLIRVTAQMPDGNVRWLVGDSSQSIGDFLCEVAMEYRLTSYKVHLASTRAILNLNSEAALIQGEDITIEEDSQPENLDPRIVNDPRLKLVHDMWKSERRYQECLRSIFDVYAEPLRKFSSLSTEDHRVLFFGLEPVLSISTSLCVKLEDAIQTWDPGTGKVGNLFSKQFWHHYQEYYSGYSSIRLLLRYKKEIDDEFVQFCQLRRGAARHSLESLLLLPVKRIPEYDDYLSNLLSQTEVSHPDYDDLSKATAKVKNMVKEREEELITVENEHRVESVQERFPNDNLQLQDKDKKNKGRRRSGSGAVWLRTLSKKHHHGSGGEKVSAVPLGLPDNANASRTISGQKIDRRYVLEGPIQLTAGLQTHDRYLFLFNDLLLVAKQRSSTTFKLKHRVRVCEMWTSEGCMEEVSEATRAAEKSFVMGWPTTNFVATFASQEMKETWLSKLKEQIQLQKEKEQPKTVILKIVNKDMENLAAAAKRLLVSNYEEAQELVKKCIEEFRIVGGESKDYQLWVASGKEDSPYPLIGHEHPYSIWMSHLRDERKDGSQEREDMVAPVEMDMNDNSVQCQFILRETKKVHKKISVEEAAKIKKKSKSPLINFFKKHKHNSSQSGPSGKLFGYHLSDVCENDEIPKSIRLLMQQLFMVGPFTQGMFRKSANHKKCQELRAKLDSGCDVSSEELPILVAGAILKDFMRSLPDSLFLCDMYDQWIDTLVLPDLSDRISRNKTLIAKLPRCHQVFIEHIMCILFYIDKFSHENSMNAYNLAICISQSMLWPHPSLGGALQTEAVEKVPLVIQFMIENCMAIFGDKCIKLFGEPMQGKPRQDSSTDSDSVQSMLSVPGQNGSKVWDESSVDSLEHGLHSELDCSPLLLKSPTNVSRDSGLTLSDTEMDSQACAAGPKQSITRSISQFDQPQHSHESHALSRSYDCTINSLHQAPVPPPRSRKTRKGSEAADFAEAHAPLMRRQAMRHCSPSHGQAEFRKHLGYSQSSSGVSDGSLGSLDECCEMDSPVNPHPMYGSDIGTLRKSESGAKLFVREDPLLRNHGLPNHQTFHDNRCSAPPQVQEMDSLQKAIARHDSLKKSHNSRSGSMDMATSQSWSDIQKLAVQSGMVQPIPENRPLNISNDHQSGRIANKQLRPSFHLTPPDSPESLDTEDYMKDYTFVVPVTTPTSTPERTGNYKFRIAPQVQNKAGTHSPVKSQASPSLSVSKRTGFSQSFDSAAPPKAHEPMDFSSYPTSSSQPGVQSNARLSSTKSVETPRSSRSKSIPLLRMGAVDMDTEGPKSPEASVEPVLVMKRNRSAMTARGADIFPGKLPNMFRHSLDEAQIMKAIHKSTDVLLSGKTIIASQSQPQSSQTSQLGESPIAACEGKDTLGGAQPTTGEKFRNNDSVEKFASDTNVKEQFEKRAQHSLGQSQASDGARPDKPPSYQEAIQRKTLLKGGMPLFQISEKDIIEQSQKGAKARQLYEDSLKKYQQESVTMDHSGVHERSSGSVSRESTPVRQQSPSPSSGSGRGQSSPGRQSVPKKPPSYEDACQRAEIIREHQHQKERQPPSYLSHKRESQSPAPTAEDRPSSSGSGTARHSSSNGSSNSSRESTPAKASLSRESSTSSSGRSKRKRDRGSSRSRERRIVHRLSDTRIQSSTARGNTNLCRSKSDSSEHLHRITRFKQHSAMEDKENVSAEDLTKTPLNKDTVRRALTPEKNSSNVPSRAVRNATPERQVTGERLSRKEDKLHRGSSPSSTSNLVRLTRTHSEERHRDSRMRRCSVPASMKNKDWHKDLAQTYSKVFYEPKTDQDQVIYSYTSPRDSATGEVKGVKPKRRGWQPPVHPTKDLIISNTNDYSSWHSNKRSTEVPEKTVVLDSMRLRSASDGLSRYDAAIKASENSTKQAKVDNKRPKEKNTSTMKPAASSKEATENVSAINWSVKKLRNLYSDPQGTAPFYQPDSQPPAGKPRGQSPYRQSPHRGKPDTRGAPEKTNPRAEEAYV